MYAIVWWVEVVFVTAVVVSISLVPAADPAPLSDRVTRWHFIGGHLLTKEMPILRIKRRRQVFL